MNGNGTPITWSFAKDIIGIFVGSLPILVTIIGAVLFLVRGNTERDKNIEYLQREIERHAKEDEARTVTMEAQIRALQIEFIKQELRLSNNPGPDQRRMP